MSADIYDEEGYFAVVPEYVLYADISPQAVRLYAVLRRHADKLSLYCYLKRETLAHRLHVGSPKVVDRAVRELEDIGVLEVIHRWYEASEPDANRGAVVHQDGPRRSQTANGYQILRHPQREGVGNRMTRGGREKDDPRPGYRMTQHKQESFKPES